MGIQTLRYNSSVKQMHQLKNGSIEITGSVPYHLSHNSRLYSTCVCMITMCTVSVCTIHFNNVATYICTCPYTYSRYYSVVL